MRPVMAQAMSTVRRILASPLFHAALAAALLSRIFLPHIEYWLRMPIEDIDEAGAYFSTYYYDLAFVRHDLHAPEWQARDAYDHPPSWKYVYGAVLHATGHPRGSLSDKEQWLWLGWGRPGLFTFSDKHAPIPVLVPMRLAAAGFVMLALALLFLVVARMASPPTAVLAVVLAALHPLVPTIATRALIDPLLLLMVVLATWGTARWLQASARPGPTAFAWSIGLGAILAFLANTKITGIPVVAGVGVAALLHFRARDDRRRSAMVVGVQLLLVAGTAVVLAIATNPTFWPDPLGGVRGMLAYRAEALRLQMRIFGGAQTSLPQAVARFGYQLLLYPDPLWHWVRFPAVALVSLVGLIRFVRRADWRSPWVCAFAGHATYWIVVAAATYRLDRLRYVAPAIPYVAFLVAFAGEGAYLWTARRSRRWIENAARVGDERPRHPSGGEGAGPGRGIGVEPTDRP